tara:strand:+ start:76 stop:525 length:450 start_codon:yes stop_codon:yes gene_type:complete
MARKAVTTLKGIILRGNVYQARLTIPKDVRDSLGLVEFTQSLDTSDLRVAKTRGEAFIIDWKRQITKARGLASPITEALLWKEELNRTKEEYKPRYKGDYSPVDDALGNRLEDIEETEGYDKARAFSHTVQGISLPSDSLVVAYAAAGN